MSTQDTARQEALRDELVALFLREGFRHFTLGDLAASLHCSKSTLYELGRSKEQLTTNILVRFFQTATDFVEHRTAGQTTPAARIATYLRAVAAALRPASPQFMADLSARPAAHTVYERNTQLAATRVGELIAEGVASGDFRPVHAAFVADTVAATMSRIQTGEIARTTGLRDSDAYEELANLVLTGISAGDPDGSDAGRSPDR